MYLKLLKLGRELNKDFFPSHNHSIFLLSNATGMLYINTYFGISSYCHPCNLNNIVFLMIRSFIF